jgi:putative ABC transport system permease protein
VKRESVYYEKQSEGTSIFIKAMGMMIAVFFSFGAMIGAMITMHASVANRQREIGTLRALGFSRRSILASFLFESVVLPWRAACVGAPRLAGDGLRALQHRELRDLVGDGLHLRADPGDPS